MLLEEKDQPVQKSYAIVQEKVEKIWCEILCVEKVSADDDFFASGGNSVLLLKATARIKKKIGLDIPHNIFFTHPKFSDLCYWLAEKITEKNSPTSLVPTQTDPLQFPLSFAQQRLWFFDQALEEKAIYHMAIPILLTGQLHVQILQKALNNVCERHKILLASIIDDADMPTFMIHHEGLLINFLDLSDSRRETQAQELVELLNEEAVKPFNLSTDPLLRLLLVKLDQHKTVLALNVHHIIFDGWSIEIFFKELSEFYNAYLNQDEPHLPTIGVQYGDFSLWQRNWLKNEVLKKNLSYWQENLAGMEVLNFPTDKKRPEILSYQKGICRSFLSPIVLEKLQHIAQRENVTLFATLLTAFEILLHRYTGSNDILIGTFFSNRHYPGIENTIGFFVNALPLRVKIKKSMRFSDLLQHVRNVIADAYENQDLPFEKLVEQLKLSRNLNINPIFQIIFGFNQGRDHAELKLSGVEAELFDLDKGFSNFDITLDVYEEEGLHLVCGYAKDLFVEETIQRFLTNFETLLQGIVGNPDQSIYQLPLLTQKEEYQLITEWNDTKIDFLTAKPISQLFEEQVARTPDAPAIIYKEKVLSYTSLNKVSNQIAHYISEIQVVKADTLIALCVQRSELIMMSILATLKTGAAYVPIDPAYPIERIEYILRDSGSKIVLVDKHTKGKLLEIQKQLSLQMLVLDDGKEFLENYLTTNLEFYDSDRLAYVMYTSGTTGTPKGVMITHHAFINTIQAIKHLCFSHRENVTTVSFTNYVFDIFGLEYGLSLFSGGSLTLLAHEQERVDCSNYDFIQMTPSICNLILDNLENTSKTKIFMGGEILPRHLLDKLLMKSQEVINFYGPTETSIWSTAKIYRANTRISNISIGYPLANETVYILDDNARAVPRGAVGELYIGGAGVARGYLNQAELTAEKFIRNPFQASEEQSFLYKTGDWGRWLSNGEGIEYMGRRDFQVKIRGHRIELGEIEQVLNAYPGVKASVVIVKTEEQALIAYYVSENALEEKFLHAHLVKKLPDYMVPKIFVHLSALPLTASGKLDRRALPEPHKQDLVGYVGPRNPLEKQVCRIWAEVLGLSAETIDIRDDFFKLGGNSILAIKLVNKLNRELNLSIKVRFLFEMRAIEHFSLLLQANAGNFLYRDYVVQDRDKINLFEPFPQSNVQQAYYIGRSSGLELGNIATHVYLEYKFIYIDVKKIEQTFNQLIQRHLALRTIFENDTQRYLEEVPYYNIPIHELANEQELLDIRNNLSHKVYEPETYPLFDVVVSKNHDGYILHMSFEYLLMDGDSLKILFDEWEKLYLDPNVKLKNLDFSYRDYIINYQKIRQSSLFSAAEKYWRDRLPVYNFEMNLPLAKNPTEIRFPKFSRISKTIKKAVWGKILAKVKEIGISPTAFILELYGKVLSHWSGQSSLCINLTLFNRIPIHAAVHDILGDFTTLGLHAYVDTEKNSIANRLKNTHQQLWTDIENNLFDGIDFQKIIRKEKSLPNNQVLSPVVLTSVLGSGQSSQDEKILDPSCQGLSYSITQTSQVWLDNNAYEINDELIAEWDYVEELFDHNTIKAMHDAYCKLIEILADSDWEKDSFPEIKLSSKDLKAIENCNIAKQTLNNDTLLSRYECFIEQNALQKQVVIFDDGLAKEYYYHQLRTDSEWLAKYIIEKMRSSDNNDEKLIAVLSEKGYGQVVSTLAVMKAGRGYLPLNVDWPLERVSEILAQANVKTVLVSAKKFAENQCEHFLNEKYQLLVVEDVLSNIHNNVQRQSKINNIVLPVIYPDDIAYVIFTSGSTGKPKGVTISHHSALNTIDAVNTKFSVRQNDVVLALSELSFDLSVYDTFGLLSVGGKIIMPKQDEMRNPSYWLKLIDTHKVTIWNTVPQLANLLMDDTAIGENNISSLRLFLLSGDWIPVELPDKISNICPQAKVISLGGATEGSIWSIWYEIDKAEIFKEKIPYGFAMPNQKIFILNHHLEQTPVDVIGEIYIGGLGVALNYWNNPTLTTDSFIIHPKYGKLYKTGDYGKLHAHGCVEFMGRKDSQVKLNGYRVELNEISAQLLKLNGTKDTIINIQKEAGKNYVIAYLLPQNSELVEEAAIIDKEAFTLQQQGVDHSLVAQYKLTFCLDEQCYRTRKSYRNFEKNNKEISYVEILNMGNVILDQLQNKLISVKEKIVDINTLNELFSAISALKSHESVLPKYRYPSAGSSYSVRVFLHSAEKIDEIAKGCYYFNPIQHTLCRADIKPLEINTTHTELYFVVYWPAIFPRYGNLSHKFVYLELGHLLGLILNVLNKNFIGYKLEIVNKNLDAENSLMAKLALGGKHIDLPENQLELDLFYKQDNKSEYYSIKNNRSLGFDQQSIFCKAKESFQLLNAAELLMTADGCETCENLIAAGILYQNMSTQLYAQNIGSCMLGDNLYADTLYSMVLGKIDQNEKNKVRSNFNYKSFREIINARLAEKLPDYMLPYDYVVLNELPLSENGKLDKSKLPKLAIKAQSLCTEPKNALENQVCNLWAEVLNIDPHQIGIHDNFFRLGGDSIMAIQLVSRLRQTFDLKISVKELFTYSTISKLITNVIHATENNNSVRPIIHANFFNSEHVIYPANSLQQGFIYHYLRRGDATDINRVQLLWEYHNAIDIEKFKKAWRYLQIKFAALRLRFAWDDGILQIMDKSAHLDWRFIDLTNENSSSQKSLIENIRHQDSAEPYKLEQGNLWRIYLLKQDAHLYTCLFSHHHIILDAWSNTILLNTLHEIYLALLADKKVDISPEYGYEIAQHFLQEHRDENKDYWHHYMERIEEKSSLSILQMHKNNQAMSYMPIVDPQEYQLKITGNLYDGIKKLCKEEALTQNVLLQFCWHKTLRVFTNNKQTVVGTTVSGRNISVNNIENSVGLFINTLPFCVDHTLLNDQNVIEAMRLMQTWLNEINLKSSINLAEIQQQGEQLFDNLFVFGNYPAFNKEIIAEKLKITFREVSIKEDYALVVSVYEINNGLNMIFKYAGELFDACMIENFVLCMEHLLKTIIANKNQLVCQLDFLGDKECQQINHWNNTERSFPIQKTIHQLFEEQVARAPNAIAIVCHKRQLTYQELNLSANSLANYISSVKEINPDNLIAIFLNRSEFTLIAMLAVLKAGAGYVPIDPTYPDQLDG